MPCHARSWWGRRGGRPPEGEYDAVVCRHVLWTLLDTHDGLWSAEQAAAQAGRICCSSKVCGSTRGGKLLSDSRLPWNGGVSAATLTGVLAPWFDEVEFFDLAASPRRFWVAPSRTNDSGGWHWQAAAGQPTERGTSAYARMDTERFERTRFLQLAEVDTPEPGPGEVRVTLRARPSIIWICGSPRVCRPLTPFHHVSGGDGAGVVRGGRLERG